MTIEELAELSGDALEKLTDKELEEILKPYFIVTRPELAPRQEKKQYDAPLVSLTPQKMEALRLLKEQNPDLDLGFLRRKKK